jgi:5-methylcytosine-specific restriction endonuclease McrA
MSKSVSRARVAAARRQNYHCYYCDLPMWGVDRDAFIAKYGVTSRQASLLQCTAEHVIERCLGGSDSASNIVAACAYCNRKRHARPQPPDSTAYRRLVQRRVSHGHWLTATLPKSLQAERQA